MTSLLDAQPGVLPQGSETPRIWTFPPSVASSGDEIADFCAENGLVLLPWQRLVLRTAMGERADGKWAASEVGVTVSRQNGKGSILEAREIGGLFLLNERIVHTAQQFRTCTDAFKRVQTLIENAPDLKSRVRKWINSPIEKSIELYSGAKLMFIARSANAGRGLTKTDLLVFDEAYDLSDPEREALVPTMTSSANPQVWYTSSAGLSHSVVLADLRRRGIEGSPTLAYMEWSVPQPERGEPLPDPDNMANVAMANPSLGTRFLGVDYLAMEAGSLTLEGRCRERLGVFDEVEGTEPPVLNAGAWADQEDADSAPESPSGVAFAVAVSQDRAWSCIASSGRRADGGNHVEIVDNRRGTRWVTERLIELRDRWQPCAVVVNPAGPEGSLIADLEEAGLEVVKPTARDLGQGFGMFYDGIMVEKTLWHRPDVVLTRAAEAARDRQLGDARTWDQRGSTDISPITAAANALWGFASFGSDRAPVIW